jgi:hypothetical protein
MVSCAGLYLKLVGTTCGMPSAPTVQADRAVRSAGTEAACQ